jgi:TonB family protein
MIRRTVWEDDHLFWAALLVSLAGHIVVSFKAGAYSLSYRQKHTVEIDITTMGHLGMIAPHPSAPAARPRPMPKPTARSKEWMKPAPNQKVEPEPVPTKPVAPVPEEPPPQALTAPAGGEYGIGTGDASSTLLSRIPQLLNLSDLSAILKRFYPEAARDERREGTVVLDIHIDTDGGVTAADVVRSGGSDFDRAAKNVVMLLHFTPAFVGSQRVNVKMRQAIQFRLSD